MVFLGVDEAGRGPLAGPVAVGIVAVESDFDINAAFPGLNDSKKLSEKKREMLYVLLREEIKKGTVRASVCFGSEKIIDTRGIAYAIRAALSRGVHSLAPSPLHTKVLLDGGLKAPPQYDQSTIIRGDATEPVIMLASIAAKVVRDRLMVRLAKVHKGYGFETHKGYGTKAHYAAIHQLGLSAIHRRTFVHLENKENQR